MMGRNILGVWAVVLGSLLTAGPHTALAQRVSTAAPLDQSILNKRVRSDQNPDDVTLLFSYTTDILNIYEMGGVESAPPAWAEITEHAAKRCDDFLNSPKTDKRVYPGLLSARGTFLWLLGKFDDAIPPLKASLALVPDNTMVARTILKIYRAKNSAKDSEALCKQTRKAIKGKDAQSSAMELLQTCVEEHPANSERSLDPKTFKKFAQWVSGKDATAFKKVLQKKVCDGVSKLCDGRCAPGCACTDRPYDRKWTRECRHDCKLCFEGCSERAGQCSAGRW